jgi:hypothetical protein
MIRVEQLVYGTFQFTRGFSLVAASPGLDSDLSHQVVDVCRSWGEILSSGFRNSLYHVPLPAGAAPLHLVGKVIRQGTDHGGRMAWYQQVLTVGHEDYVTVGADPFAFDEAGFFRDRWFESDECETIHVEPGLLPRFDRSRIAPTDHERIEAMITALAGGLEVRLFAKRATRAVTASLRQTLCMLPVARRAEIAVSSFAFRPVRRFDLWCLHESGGEEPETTAAVNYWIGQENDEESSEPSATAEGSRRAMALLRAERYEELETLLAGGVSP